MTKWASERGSDRYGDGGGGGSHVSVYGVCVNVFVCDMLGGLGCRE